MRHAALAAAQLQGAEAALGHIFESPWAFVRAAGLFIVVAFIAGGYSLISAWQIWNTAPVSVRTSLIINTAMFPAAVGGFALSICVALAIARRSYRRAVRPLLFARAPLQPGLPARCRACGGPLPDGRDAFVMCRYCNTQSLVTPELERDRVQLLQGEQRFYTDRAHRVVAATTSLPNTQRILLVSCLLIYGLMIGLAALSNALLPS